MKNLGLHVVITPEDIYGPGWEEDVPPGWEVDRFGVAESWEPLLSRPPRDRDLLYRIILRKTKVKKIVFTFVARRVPRFGEWYESFDGEAMFYCGTGEYNDDRDIYTRTEIEE